MNPAEIQKENFELQFQELIKKATEIYPDIESSLSILNNSIADTKNIQDFLNLTVLTPTETASNQIYIS